MKMGIKRIVDTDFWKDEKVIDNYSPEDKYFWLYLLTNPQTRQLGVYKLPRKIIAFETGYSLDTVNVLLERFQSKYKVIAYSSESQEIAIFNYLKYSIVKGGKPVIDCITKDISLVKDTSLLGIVYCKICGSTDDRETINTIREMLSLYKNDNDIHNDNDNDSIVPRFVPRIVDEPEKPIKNNKFIPPTIEQVQEYCKERNNTVDAEKFVNHYASSNWFRGKTKLKDWKACVRTWEKNEKDKLTTTHQNPPQQSSNPFLDRLKKMGEMQSE
jgi:hypothetical protein